jgi:hypothetical protein
MTLQKLNVTETDIIKKVTLKRQFESIYNGLANKEKSEAAINDLSASNHKIERKSQVKLAMKLWLALGKFIRSQCNKDKVVDTLFFGTFAKASVLNKGDDYYAYCPGPKAVFKLVENRENVADIADSILSERLTTLNVSSVAEVCNTTSDVVTALMSGIRDEIVEIIKSKKVNMVSLHFPIGVLNLNKAGQVEFKSNEV